MSSPSQELRLKVQEENFPAFQFAKVPFVVSLSLVDSQNLLHQGSIEHPELEVKLYYENTPGGKEPGEECISSLYSASSENGTGLPVLNKNGTAKVTLAINELSHDHKDRRFVFKISARIGSGASSSAAAAAAESSDQDQSVPTISAISPPITIVRYKIVISENHKDMVEGKSFKWLKEKGGKSNCIELDVALKDASGAIVTDRKVNLTATLCYNGGEVVKKQELLTFSKDSRLVLDDATSAGSPAMLVGRTTLKYRIEEVSSNHQKQSFTVHLLPDIEANPLNSDISGAYSMPVTVLSKVNAKQQALKIMKRVHSMGFGGGGTNNDLYPLNNPGYSDYELINNARSVSAPVSVKRQKLDLPPHNPFAAPTIADLRTVSDEISGADPSAAPMEMRATSDGSTCSYVSSVGSEAGRVVESSTTREAREKAVDEVIQWTHSVISGLNRMKWQPGSDSVLGGNGGASNGGIKVYSVPDPSELIDSLVNSYHSVVKRHLQYLKDVKYDGVVRHEAGPRGDARMDSVYYMMLRGFRVKPNWESGSSEPWIGIPLFDVREKMVGYWCFSEDAFTTGQEFLPAKDCNSIECAKRTAELRDLVVLSESSTSSSSSPAPLGDKAVAMSVLTNVLKHQDLASMLSAGVESVLKHSLSTQLR